MVRPGEVRWCPRAGSLNPSQGGQYCRITPLEEGVAPARGPTICDAPLYAVPLPPYSLDVRFGGSGTAYSKAAHIPVRRAGATPLSLKVHPLCLQYAELGQRGSKSFETVLRQF